MQKIKLGKLTAIYKTKISPLKFVEVTGRATASSAFKKVEKLPWYASLILGLSLFILCVTLGFAIGIIVQKDKLVRVQNQLNNQNKEEQQRIKKIIQFYQEKNSTQPRSTTNSSSLK